MPERINVLVFHSRSETDTARESPSHRVQQRLFGVEVASLQGNQSAIENIDIYSMTNTP